MRNIQNEDELTKSISGDFGISEGAASEKPEKNPLGDPPGHSDPVSISDADVFDGQL